MTVAEQAAKADVIADGVVVKIDTRTLEDGFVVTLLRLQVTDVLRGTVPSRTLTLGLPGAQIGGVWVGVDDIPTVKLGDELVVFGSAVNANDVAMLGATQSVFRKVHGKGGDIAADFDGNPLIDPGCTEDRLIARPADQAPVGEVGQRTENGPIDVTPKDRVFLADPESAALPWPVFLTNLKVCIDSQPASAGATSVLGGGW